MSWYGTEGIGSLVSKGILPRLRRWYRVMREGSRISASMREHAPKSRRES